MSPKLQKLMRHMGGRASAAPAAPWTPATAEGTLKLWLDPTDNATLTMDGSNVAAILDKGIHASTWVQATGANQSVLGTLSGKQSISVASPDTYESTGFAMDSNKPLLVFFAIRITGFPTGQFPLFIKVGDGSVPALICHIQSGNMNSRGIGWHAGPAQSSYPDAWFDHGLPFTDPFSLTGIGAYDGSELAAGWTMRLNGVVTALGTSDGQPNDTSVGTLFSNPAFGGNECFQGEFGQLGLIEDFTPADLAGAITFAETNWPAP